MEAATTLAAAGIEQPMLDARLLLAHTLGVSPTRLLLCDQDPITTTHRTQLRQLVAQRAAGVPLAYLTGTREFMGLEFHTSPAVLVPRPDTEPLVEWALAWMGDHPAAHVADIGTGSGAIAISFTHQAPESWGGRVTAIDVSPEALAVAAGNADRLLSPDRRVQIAFRIGDLTAPLDDPVDLLLANLPYLTPAQMVENADLRHEPALALDGGDDGLDLVRRVIADLPRVLHPTGAVGFEIDPSQSAMVQALLRTALPHHQIGVVHDLAHDERHVVAWFV